jgi:AbrB family looped-hinge helix DNA binding protein
LTDIQIGNIITCNSITSVSHSILLRGDIMRVTTKGQVTIPLEIRKKLNITPASDVKFIVDENDRVYIEKVKDSEGGVSRFSKLRGSATVKMSTDEIMALTRTAK